MPKDEAKPQPMTDEELGQIRRLANVGPLGLNAGGIADRAFAGMTRLLAEVDRLRAVTDDDTSLLDWASTNYAKHDGMISEAVEEGWQLRDALRGARDGTLADDIYGDDDED